MASDHMQVPEKIGNRHPAAAKSDPGLTPWVMKGKLILNCNGMVFCPCVVSPGKHTPTEGHCQTWGGVRAFGRMWDFDGSSAEICQIGWRGPR